MSGFTLIEVVVAFAVLAFVLIGVTELFSRGLARSGELEDYSQALLIAQSKIAAVGVEGPAQEGDTTGVTPDGRYRWLVAVRRVEETPAEGAKPAVSPYPLFRVDANVAWDSSGRQRRVSLATLVLSQQQQATR